MEFGGASLRSVLRFSVVFTTLAAVVQIPAVLAQNAPQNVAQNPPVAPGDLPVALISPDICTVQGLPVPDPLDEVSVTTSVLAVMGDVPPPTQIYDDSRANDCCVLITPPDHEYRISIAARLAVEARFLRLQDENAVRHLYQLIEYCEDEITQAAFLSAYGGPLGDGLTRGPVDPGGGGGGGPPNASPN